MSFTAPMKLLQTVFASGVFWTIKNPNREWLVTASSPRKKANIVPWPGVLPTSCIKTRAVLIGRMSRSMQLELSDELLSIVILEYALELFLLHFAVSTIRAILHAIPNLRACHFARRVFREWTVGLAATVGSRGNGKSRGFDKSGGGCRFSLVSSPAFREDGTYPATKETPPPRRLTLFAQQHVVQHFLWAEDSQGGALPCKPFKHVPGVSSGKAEVPLGRFFAMSRAGFG